MQSLTAKLNYTCILKTYFGAFLKLILSFFFPFFLKSFLGFFFFSHLKVFWAFLLFVILKWLLYECRMACSQILYNVLGFLFFFSKIHSAEKLHIRFSRLIRIYNHCWCLKWQKKKLNDFVNRTFIGLDAQKFETSIEVSLIYISFTIVH